jgi:hypothetical protein
MDEKQYFEQFVGDSDEDDVTGYMSYAQTSDDKIVPYQFIRVENIPIIMEGIAPFGVRLDDNLFPFEQTLDDH